MLRGSAKRFTDEDRWASSKMDKVPERPLDNNQPIAKAKQSARTLRLP
jgi:hypothetical protein